MKKFRKANELDDLDLDNLEFEEETIEIDEKKDNKNKIEEYRKLSLLVKGAQKLIDVKKGIKFLEKELKNK